MNKSFNFGAKAALCAIVVLVLYFSASLLREVSVGSGLKKTAEDRDKSFKLELDRQLKSNELYYTKLALDYYSLGQRSCFCSPRTNTGSYILSSKEYAEMTNITFKHVEAINKLLLRGK